MIVTNNSVCKRKNHDRDLDNCWQVAKRLKTDHWSDDATLVTTKRSNNLAQTVIYGYFCDTHAKKEWWTIAPFNSFVVRENEILSYLLSNKTQYISTVQKTYNINCMDQYWVDYKFEHRDYGQIIRLQWLVWR